MERSEAVSFLKEFLSISMGVSPNSITIDEPVNKKGYQLCIKGERQPQTVTELARKRNLAVKQDQDVITVYKP